MAYTSKEEARAVTAQIRKQRTTSSLAQAGNKLANHDWVALIGGNRATCYVSMDYEPPTDRLLQALAKADIECWVPIMKKGRSLEWGKHEGELFINDFGVSEPKSDETFNLESVSALIIPAQRAGIDGTRLGRGAGYYDRALAVLPPFSGGGPKRIVIVFDEEVDDSVPHDTWDEFMDVIVTPSRVMNIKK
jgi:5-formyltetrahydrofolate cyclo-ligase